LQNNNHENERIRPRLESASELKGKKAQGKSTSIGKKRAITLISLLLVLAIAAGAYFVTDALKPVEETVEQTQSTEIIYMLDEGSKNDLASLTVLENGAETFTVISNLKEKADIAAAEKAAADASDEETASAADSIPDYEIEGMPYFRADSSLVTPMVTYSYSILAAKVVEEGAEDLAAYGLVDPQLQIVFNYHDGRQTRFNIGDKVPAGDYYYCTLDDSTDVYMVYKTVPGYYTRDLTELHVVPAVTAVDAENLVYILAEQKDKETIEIVLRDTEEETTSVADVMLVQPFNHDANSDRASQTMISAAELKLTAYAGYAADETELAQFGLAEPFARVKVADANDLAIDMTIGDIVKGNSAYRYATVDGSGEVYTVDVRLLGFLDNCRVSYLVDQFAGLVNIKQVDSYTITTADKTYTTTVENTPYTTEDGRDLVKQDFYFQGQYVNEDIYRDFYQVVIGRLFDKRIEDPAEYYFDGEVIMKISYDLNYQDEPYTVEYLDYDRDYAAVRRDGVCLFLIRKDKVQEIIDTAELLEKGEYEGIDDTIDYNEIYGDLSYYE